MLDLVWKAHSAFLHIQTAAKRASPLAVLAMLVGGLGPRV